MITKAMVFAMIGDYDDNHDNVDDDIVDDYSWQWWWLDVNGDDNEDGWYDYDDENNGH